MVKLSSCMIPLFVVFIGLVFLVHVWEVKVIFWCKNTPNFWHFKHIEFGNKVKVISHHFTWKLDERSSSYHASWKIDWGWLKADLSTWLASGSLTRTKLGNSTRIQWNNCINNWFNWTLTTSVKGRGTVSILVVVLLNLKHLL